MMKDLNYRIEINNSLNVFVKYCIERGSRHPYAYYIHVNKWINGALSIDKDKELTPQQRITLIIFSRLLDKCINTLIDNEDDYHSIKEVVFKCLKLSNDIYISRQHTPKLKVLTGGANKKKII